MVVVGSDGGGGCVCHVVGACVGYVGRIDGGPLGMNGGGRIAGGVIP